MLRTSAPLIGALGVKGKVRVPGSVALILIVLATLLPAQAESQITDSLPSPPQSFVDELETEGCTVKPRSGDDELSTNNLISGALASNGQTDWAALCTVKNGHYIRIRWGGTKTCSSRIDIETTSLDKISHAEYASDHSLALATKDYILAHYRDYGGPKSPSLDHLGINYIYVGKASVVFYCHEEKWLALTGAD